MDYDRIVDAKLQIYFDKCKENDVKVSEIFNNSVASDKQTRAEARMRDILDEVKRRRGYSDETGFDGVYKSDDLVTYDDDGNAIMPSKRFDRSKSDPRYSLKEMSDVDNPSARLSLVEDKDEIERLENEELVPGYRNVVMNAGGDFGSPMAGTLGNTGRGKERTLPFSKGVWEKSDERPWLVDENGKINLGKPDF